MCKNYNYQSHNAPNVNDSDKLALVFYLRKNLLSCYQCRYWFSTQQGKLAVNGKSLKTKFKMQTNF